DALNGMFAFAIWDTRTRTLFVARDRMGVKPLYYAETPAAFLFASEVKSIFASGLVRPECREEAIPEYLLFRQVAGPDTIFRGIRALPPGCHMTVRDGRSRIGRYWSPRPPADRPAITYDDAREQLAALLQDSVRMRLVSDVPVGTFCSGGVDSSLVTAYAARLKGEGVNTYSIGFDEADFDESAFARMAADHCRTKHHELRVGHAEFDELLPRMAWHNDEPLDFANSIQIYALSALAKQEVTVVLTGEGSDELFAGYPRYKIPQLAGYARMVPGPLRRLAAVASGDHRLAKLDRYASGSADDAIMFNASYQSAATVARVYPRIDRYASAYRQECLEAGAALDLDEAARASLLDQETFLVGILNRQDKMSMAASIESRVPFMDYRLVEFANRLPTAVKLKGGDTKALVKDIARDVLPAAIVDRRKSGFGVPLARWFRANDGLGARMQALAARNDGTFDTAGLRRVVEEHRSGSHDHSELLWTVLSLETWREAFGC
ncbi:MAG: asparagine synthase (glutamine-hydrolyzing), partial [Acidobacteria bacterium]|nr:asparagine synthase (glutamine-hydrolyzing) [Acidobacteriota bacterium]